MRHLIATYVAVFGLNCGGTLAFATGDYEFYIVDAKTYCYAQTNGNDSHTSDYDFDSGDTTATSQLEFTGSADGRADLVEIVGNSQTTIQPDGTPNASLASQSQMSCEITGANAPFYATGGAGTWGQWQWELDSSNMPDDSPVQVEGEVEISWSGNYYGGYESFYYYVWWLEDGADPGPNDVPMLAVVRNPLGDVYYSYNGDTPQPLPTDYDNDSFNFPYVINDYKTPLVGDHLRIECNSGAGEEYMYAGPPSNLLVNRMMTLTTDTLVTDP